MAMKRIVPFAGADLPVKAERNHPIRNFVQRAAILVVGLAVISTYATAQKRQKIVDRVFSPGDTILVANGDTAILGGFSNFNMEANIRLNREGGKVTSADIGFGGRRDITIGGQTYSLALCGLYFDNPGNPAGPRAQITVEKVIADSH